MIQEKGEANLAVALNPKEEYVLLQVESEQGPERLLLAEALVKDVQQLFGLPRVQVKSVAADEFQRVPLRRVVAGGDRNAARRVERLDRKLHRRRGADASPRPR